MDRANPWLPRAWKIVVIGINCIGKGRGENENLWAQII